MIVTGGGPVIKVCNESDNLKDNKKVHMTFYNRHWVSLHLKIIKLSKAEYQSRSIYFNKHSYCLHFILILSGL